jgi:DNA-binding MarR family transcriptional regulator
LYDRLMERQDLGAMFAQITRRLIDAERPILEAHGLSMWGYIALARLSERPAETQLALAQTMGYDKTRLVTLLDELEQDGVLTRRPDPADRRARLVQLTPAGLRLLRAARADIREMEGVVLDVLDPADRATLLALLPRLVPGPEAGR